MIYVLAVNKQHCEQMTMYGYTTSEYKYVDNLDRIRGVFGIVFILEGAANMCRGKPVKERYKTIMDEVLSKHMPIQFKPKKCQEVIYEAKMRNDRNDLYCCW